MQDLILVIEKTLHELQFSIMLDLLSRLVTYPSYMKQLRTSFSSKIDTMKILYHRTANFYGIKFSG